jgi:hypothetical protein
MREDSKQSQSVEGWMTEAHSRPEDVPADGWLRYEQDKHTRLLAASASTT